MQGEIKPLYSPNLKGVTNFFFDRLLRRKQQKPLISGFGAKTTAEEALAGRDLRGKVAIVTVVMPGSGLRQPAFWPTQEPTL
jgi:hypothetical protein